MNNSAPSSSNSKNPTQNAYALVDRDFRQDIPKRLNALSLAAGPLEENADMLPSLVRVFAEDPDDGDVLKAIAADKTPWFMTLLESAEGDHVVQAHVASMQLLQGPKQKRAWLRLHDPWVMLQLWRVLSAPLKCQLFGPIERWYILINGEWNHFRRPQQTGPAPATSLYLDADTWDAIERIGVINRTLARLGIADPRKIFEISPAFDQLIIRGQRHYRLARTDDLVSYLCYCHQVDMNFDQSPGMQREIAHFYARQKDASDANVIDLFDRFTKQDWSSIRNEAIAIRSRT